MQNTLRCANGWLAWLVLLLLARFCWLWLQGCRLDPDVHPSPMTN
jgi:hypothetical protein